MLIRFIRLRSGGFFEAERLPQSIDWGLNGVWQALRAVGDLSWAAGPTVPAVPAGLDLRYSADTILLVISLGGSRILNLRIVRKATVVTIRRRGVAVAPFLIG
jgi:hypothetical protein